MDPLIIACAITGAETSVKKQPHLPVTPEQQGLACAEIFAAGARIVHLHVRDQNGRPSQSLRDFENAMTEIQNKAPEIIIQFSTGGAVGESFENRMAPLNLKPHMASLNMGTMNFGDDVFMNHPKDIQKLAALLIDQEISPELEIYEVGMLEAALKMFKKDELKAPLHFQFVLGVPGGMSGEVRNLEFLLKILQTELKPNQYTWAVAGIGRHEFPLSQKAIEWGGHVRVGFEDNIYIKKGQLAHSNAQLVSHVVELAEKAGRSIASAEEARVLLSLKS